MKWKRKPKNNGTNLRSGFRPSEIRYTQNEIEAIKKHLKEEREMRKEMFDILLDEKKQSLKSKPDPELKSDTSDMR